MTIPLVELAQQKVASFLSPGAIVIDATMGNGHDTAFLAEKVGKKGKVYAFDCQKAALLATARRLEEAGLREQSLLIEADHRRLAEQIERDDLGKVCAVMFNLGYLPGDDKQYRTSITSTLQALDSAVEVLAPVGVISIIAYTGHEGGREEAEAVKEWTSDLRETQYKVGITIPEGCKNSPPELILIEARG